MQSLFFFGVFGFVIRTRREARLRERHTAQGRQEMRQELERLKAIENEGFLRAAADKHSKGELVINSARYGIGPEAGQFRDVTERVRGLIEGGVLKIPGGRQVKNHLFGDPFRDREKTLEVKFTSGGEVRQVTVHEDQELNLP